LAHRAHARRVARGPALADHHARDGRDGTIHDGQPADEKLQAALREHQWGAGRAPGGVVNGRMHRSRGVHGGGGHDGDALTTRASPGGR
jgi:hypothetical protein